MRNNGGMVIVVGYNSNAGINVLFPLGCVVFYNHNSRYWVNLGSGYVAPLNHLLVADIPQTEIEKQTLIMLYPHLEGKI